MFQQEKMGQYQLYDICSKNNISILERDKVSQYRVLLLLLWPLMQMLIAVFYREYGDTEYVNFNLFLGLVFPLPLLILYCYDNKVSFRQIMSHLADPIFILLILSWLPGALFGLNIVYSLMFICLVFLSFLISSAYVYICYDEEVRIAVSIFAITCPVFLLAKGIIDGQLFSSSRSSGFDVLPINSIAFFSMTCACFAFAWKNHVMKVTTLVIGSILLFTTNSRSCILGLFFAVITYYYLYYRRKMSWAWKSVFILFVTTLLIFIGYEIYYAIDKVLYLQDASRGIVSGFSGRTERWRLAVETISDNMVLGIGFKCSNKYFGFPLDNGYLMYLVENGVISGALATAYIGRAIFQSLSNTRMSDMEMVFLSASVGYLIHSIFESFIFNVGNSGSLLFIFWLVYARKLMRNGKVL